MQRKKLITMILATFMAMNASMPVAFAKLLPVRVSADDTVAGYATALYTSLMDAGQNIIFKVERPNKTVINIPATADVSGRAEADLYGQQTKQAGVYTVTAQFPGSQDTTPSSVFNVFADEVSTTQSDLLVSDSMVDAGTPDDTFVTVQLYDQYRNPVANHQLKLISSRSEDSIEVIADGTTDENGRANFRVSSDYPGISTFSAFDLTASKILADREEVVFMATATKRDIGGPFQANLLSANIGQGNNVLPGPVDKFEIRDLPATAKVGEELSMTIVALDRNGNVAKNYTGTVIISTSDENAQLPSNREYTFRETDQGEFTFNLALVFTQIGVQTLQVLDSNNFGISGETTIEIVPEGAVVSGTGSTTLAIKSPSDGSELASSTVILSGKGDPLINLRVFNNDSKIGDTSTDEDGFFTYTAQGLESGTHTFYVMSEQGQVSRSVNIVIDTVAPVLDFFEVFPDGPVEAGQNVTVTVRSERDLQEAKLRIQGVDEFLAQDPLTPGTYSADIAAPQNEGNFPIDVILIDQLSNKSEFSGKGTITVQAPQPVNPPTVQGLNVVPSDGRVTLTWEPVTGSNSIQKYRIVYGTAFDNLDQSAEAAGSETSLTVANLLNGTQYFFALYAVDNKGNESEQPSVTIAATPISATPAVAIPPAPTPMPTSAPLQLTATPQAGSVVLSWVPFAGVQASFYKVYFGFASTAYDDFVITPTASTTATVRDLIDGVPYYFSVVALNELGQEISPLSPEATVTPGVTGLRASAPVFTPTLDSQLAAVSQNAETGSEAVWIVLASIIFAQIFYTHKRNILKSQQ